MRRIKVRLGKDKNGKSEGKLEKRRREREGVVGGGN